MNPEITLNLAQRFGRLSHHETVIQKDKQHARPFRKVKAASPEGFQIDRRWIAVHPFAILFEDSVIGGDKFSFG